MTISPLGVVAGESSVSRPFLRDNIYINTILGTRLIECLIDLRHASLFPHPLAIVHLRDCSSTGSAGRFDERNLGEI